MCSAKCDLLCYQGVFHLAQCPLHYCTVLSPNAGEQRNDDPDQELACRRSGSQQQAQSTPPESDSVAAEDARLGPTCACLAASCSAAVGACTAMLRQLAMILPFTQARQGRVLLISQSIHGNTQAIAHDSSHQAILVVCWPIGHLRWCKSHLCSSTLPATSPCTHFFVPGTLGDTIQAISPLTTNTVSALRTITS